MSAKPQIQVSGAMGIPLNKQGEFLITLRNQPKDPAAHNKWQITGGGIEFGETPEQALAREMQEELSVSVRILYPHPIAKTWTWDFKDKHLHVLLLCYIVDIGDQKPVVDGKENSSFRWIKPKQIHTLNHLPLTDDLIFESEKLVKDYNLIAQLS